jgi:hypothetical protein
MRALRVLGLAEAPANGTVKNLVCEDPLTGEQFSVPCDDRLRAGARGDLSRFGQLEIELESQLRPREIQSKIRAGATVEEVASLAGTTTSRVERFAYPVLLERASVVEKAKKARPAIDGITAGISVAETVAATLAARGHDADMKWDAFKDDEGWVLALTWSAGRSENRAQWLFHPGPDGGTLSARDEAAAEIVDPALRILRPLRPVRPDTVSSVLLDPTIATERPIDRTSVRSGEPGARSAHPAGSKLPAAVSSPISRPGSTSGDRSAGRGRGFRVPVDQLEGTAPQSSHPHPHPDQVSAQRIVEDTVTDDRTGVNPVITRREVALTGTESARAVPTASAASSISPSNATPATGIASTGTASTGLSTPPPAAATPRTTAPAIAAPTGAVKAPRKGHRPSMPSWEDVLLGTRSNGH